MSAYRIGGSIVVRLVAALRPVGRCSVAQACEGELDEADRRIA